MTSTLDSVFVTFAAHEIRDRAAQRELFGELRRVLRPDGRLIVTEHLRDIANVAVYGPGAFHFQPAGTWIDRAVMFSAVAGFSVPGFVLGLVLVLVFAVHLGWLPSGGNDAWTSPILPVITLSTGWSAVLARFTRGSMVEVLGQPYIRTASAKGLLWRAVVTRHALPNAAIPIVTTIGFMVGGLLAGAVVTESVFSWPGLGQLIVQSVAARDVAVVQCILLLVATTMVLSNMTVDLLYSLLDPRLRTGSQA